MAVKKKAKKKVTKTPVEVDMRRKMTAPEIKELQKMAADIGSGKKSGYIFIATTEDTPKGIHMEGTAFIHNSNKMNILTTIIENLQLSPLETAVAFREALTGGGKPDHEHDAKGKCLI